MGNEKVHIFLCGEYRANAGPSNVNRYLLKSPAHRFSYIKSDNAVLKQIEKCWNIFSNDVTVFSGYGNYCGFLKILRALHKKSVYLMHGCVDYENNINELGLDRKLIRIEDYILHNTDLILCVSEKYMEWVVRRYPDLRNRVYYLNSGIDTKEYEHVSFSRELSDEKLVKIVAAGGDRNQKNNLEICEAVEIIASSTTKKIELNIFGRCYAKHNSFSEYPHTKYRGMVPKENFYQELCNSDLFILNSEIESFGLSVVDALMCGCSILITNNAGICSLISLQANEVIYNVHDPNEIAEKIRYLVEHPNNSRLRKLINYDNCKWEKVVERLYSICTYLITGKDYTSIK